MSVQNRNPGIQASRNTQDAAVQCNILVNPKEDNLNVEANSICDTFSDMSTVMDSSQDYWEPNRSEW